MADDLPYMKFFPADYLADCDVLSVGARGAWHTFLCKAWLARSASVSLKPAQWSRVFGATNAEQAERLIAEIEECEVGDVIRDEAGRVTLVSRRIERDLKEMGVARKVKSEAARKAAEARWAKHRQSEADPPGMRDACEAHAEGNADAMRGDAMPEARVQKPEKDPPAPHGGSGDREILSMIWDAWPKRGRERSTKAKVANAWKRIPVKERPDPEAALAALKAWKRCEQWLKDGGEFVPAVDRMIRDRYWESPPEEENRTGRGFVSRKPRPLPPSSDDFSSGKEAAEFFEKCESQ